MTEETVKGVEEVELVGGPLDGTKVWIPSQVTRYEKWVFDGWKFWERRPGTNLFDLKGPVDDRR